MKNLMLVASIGLSVALLLYGCTPATTPPPAPLSTQSAPVAAAQTKPATPPTSSEDAGWAQVVSDAKKEGKVTLYSFRFTGEIGDAVRRGFENRYGIKADIVAGLGSVHFERLKSEQAAKKNIADTYDTALTFVNLAKGEGLTQSWGDLPVLSEKGIWDPFPRIDSEGHMMAIGQGWFNIYVNTNQVIPADEPKSYKDFLLPRWKGKVVVGHPATTPNTVLLYMIGKKYGFLDDSYFKQLAANGAIVAPNVREAGNKLMTGEASFQMVGANITHNIFIKEGSPAKVLTTEEGSIRYLLNPLTLVRGAPHPNAARVFMNWFLSKEGQSIYHQAAASPSLRQDVPDFSPPGAKFVPQRTLDVDLAMEIEAGKVQRDRVVDKLLGLER